MRGWARVAVSLPDRPERFCEGRWRRAGSLFSRDGSFLRSEGFQGVQGVQGVQEVREVQEAEEAKAVARPLRRPGAHSRPPRSVSCSTRRLIFLRIEPQLESINVS